MSKKRKSRTAFLNEKKTTSKSMVEKSKVLKQVKAYNTRANASKRSHPSDETTDESDNSVISSSPPGAGLQTRTNRRSRRTIHHVIDSSELSDILTPPPSNRHRKSGLASERNDASRLPPISLLTPQGVHDSLGFQSKADEYSLSEASDSLASLNSAIMQASATIAEYALCQENKGQKLMKCKGKRREQAGRFLDVFDRNYADQLGSSLSHPKRKTLMQLALRASLTRYCKAYVCQWTYPLQEDKEIVLHNLYTAVTSSEPLPVAGKWRSITMKQTKREDYPSILQDLGRRACDVLVISGWPAPEKNAALKLQLEKSLEAVPRLLGALEERVNRGITSYRLDVYFPYAGVAFCSDFMLDGDSSGAVNSEDFVGCSIGLGVRVSNERGNDAITTIRKALVIRQACMDVLCRPPSHIVISPQKPGNGDSDGNLKPMLRLKYT